MKRGLGVPPSPAQMNRRYASRIKNMANARFEPLYDYQTLAAAGAVSQRFFIEPIGQSDKTETDTNMTNSGLLPTGNRFLVTGVQVELYPGVTLNGSAASAFQDDIYDVYKGGRLRLKIGDKNWIDNGNLMQFCPVNYLETDSSTTVATDRYAYARAGGRPFELVDLAIEANQAFSVTLFDLAALPSGQDARIGVRLLGYRYESVQ